MRQACYLGITPSPPSTLPSYHPIEHVRQALELRLSSLQQGWAQYLDAADEALASVDLSAQVKPPVLTLTLTLTRTRTRTRTLTLTLTRPSHP